MHIAAIICENGLGHFKRTLGLLYEIKHKYPYCKIDIVCHERQITLTSDWIKTNFLLTQPEVSFHTDILYPSIHWTEFPEKFQNNQLLAWIDRLNKANFMHEADLVISDNLTGVLTIRPDTILMGSFLWFEILKNSYSTDKNVNDFVEADLKLLNQHRPPMICVHDIVMPSVQQYTNAIGMPWFAQEKRIPKRLNSLSNRIAISAGASSLSNQLIMTILHQLIEKNTYQLSIPERAIELLDTFYQKDIIPFHFKIEEFQNCDIAICRPGVGTITDCITAQTPMLLYFEEGNLEMMHNAQKLEELGIAVSVGSNYTSETLIKALEEIHNLEVLQAMVKRIQAVSVNGFETALTWLEENGYLIEQRLAEAVSKNN